MKEIHKVEKFEPYPYARFLMRNSKEIDGKIYRRVNFSIVSFHFINKLICKSLERKGYLIHIEYIKGDEKIS